MQPGAWGGLHNQRAQQQNLEWNDFEMNKNSPSVFLAGATGYIGSRVLDVLLSERPDLKVLALTRRPEGADALRKRGVTPIIGDVTKPGSWQETARNANYIIHVAQPAAFSQRQTDAFGRKYEIERLAQDQGLFGALDPTRKQRIVYVSGHSYFGETGRARPLDETMTPKPMGFGPYIVSAISNVQAEIARGLDIIAVYPGAVYAYGSWTKQYIIDRLKADKSLMAMSGASAYASPIHIVDCARAIVSMLSLDDAKVKKLGRDFLLIDDQPVTYDEMNQTFAKAMGKKVKYFTMPGFLAKLMMGSITYNYQISDCMYSNARLKATGFKFRFPSIKQGAPDIVAEAQRKWATA
jgi:nucleoside-diphosphate-sugar epimerase